MLSDILQIIGQALFEIAGYFIGRLVIAAVSLGRWRCEPLLTVVPKRERRWGGLFHYRNGLIYFTSEGASLIGVLFFLILVCGWIVIRYGW